MANKPFDRTILNPLEQVLSGDLNQGFSEVDQTIREFILRTRSGRTGVAPQTAGANDPQGFIGSGLQVSPTGIPSMNVLVNPGLGFVDAGTDEPSAIGGVTGLNDLPISKPISLTTLTNFVVPANTSGSARVDVIEVSYSRLVTDSSSRNVWDPVARKFNPGLVDKTLSFNLDGRSAQGAGAATAPLYYKVGTPGAGAPAVDPGYVALAEILVPNGAAAIDYDGVIDMRQMISPNGIIEVGCDLTFANTGAGAPVVISDVVAPPGVRVGVDPNPGLAAGYYECALVIACGAAPRLALMSATAKVSASPGIGNYTWPALNAPTPASAVVREPAIAALTSFVQGHLLDPAASPTLKLAVGQPVVWAGIGLPYSYIDTGNNVYRASVKATILL